MFAGLKWRKVWFGETKRMRKDIKNVAWFGKGVDSRIVSANRCKQTHDPPFSHSWVWQTVGVNHCRNAY
jgi:hypothetical protein